MEVPTLALSAPRDSRPLMTSSSMTAAARSQYLLDLLAQVPDPRKRRGRRHSLGGLLAVGVAAVIAGSRSFAAVGQWAADAATDEVPRDVEHDTIGGHAEPLGGRFLCRDSFYRGSASSPVMPPMSACLPS